VINDFNTDITIHENAKIMVTETIATTFSEDRHGIYRDIRSDGLQINILTVTDEKGYPRTYTEESWSGPPERSGGSSDRAGGPRIRIGDADKLINGAQTYQITYEAENAMGFFEDHDELYWNATGTGWATAIESAHATVQLPSKAKGQKIQLKCYTGAYGSTVQDCDALYNPRSNTASFKANNPLYSYQGLTLVVGFPVGVLERPAGIRVNSNVKGASARLNGESFCNTPCEITPLESGTYSVMVSKFGFSTSEPKTFNLKAGEWTDAFFELKTAWWFFPLYSLAFILLALIAFEPIITYIKKGRDAKGRGTIIPEYEAPDHLRPAEMGTLVDEQADLRDLSSTIVDLAVRGYLKIKVLPKALGLLFKEDDHELIRIDKPKPNDPGLTDFEEKYMTAIFNVGTTRKVSALFNQFYKDLPDLKKSLYKRVTEKGYFAKSPDQIRTGYLIKGIGFTAFAFIALQFVLPFGLAAPRSLFLFLAFFLAALLANGALTLIFSHFMPRKTSQGRLAYEKVLGFKQYLTVAEKDRLKFQENENLFYTFLPYAMTLGIADKWSKAFKDVFQKPPEWYEGGSGPFHPSVFIHDLGRFSGHMNSAMVSTPRGSSSGGFHSSGFSGGFSGGGGGGGGGGSW